MSGDLARENVTPVWKATQLARPNKRYRRKVASPKQWAAIRAAKVDGFPCRVCLEVGNHDPHHIIPRDRGGDDIAENIAPLCRRDHELVEGRDRVACMKLVVSTFYSQPEPGPNGGARDECRVNATAQSYAISAAFTYARGRVLDGETPYLAALEAWNEHGLHGGDRQAFIDAVEAAAITPTTNEPAGTTLRDAPTGSDRRQG